MPKYSLQVTVIHISFSESQDPLLVELMRLQKNAGYLCPGGERDGFGYKETNLFSKPTVLLKIAFC